MGLQPTSHDIELAETDKSELRGSAVTTPPTPLKPQPPGSLNSRTETISATISARHATRKRKRILLGTSACYFCSVMLLIFVEVGNTHDRAGIRDLWFYKLDLSHIIPVSVPNASLINSIARSLGLHDFYQVGLWNFCEGYLDEGIVHCSPPSRFFWFNPVEVITGELLAGATIALPNEVNRVLQVLRGTSQAMFGCFIVGLIFSSLLMLAGPVAVYSRWWSLPFSFFSIIAATLVMVGTTIATATSIIFKTVLTQQNELNIQAHIGTRMLALMWTSTILTAIAALFHSALGCCGTSRRDVKRVSTSIY